MYIHHRPDHNLLYTCQIELENSHSIIDWLVVYTHGGLSSDVSAAHNPGSFERLVSGCTRLLPQQLQTRHL